MSQTPKTLPPGMAALLEVLPEAQRKAFEEAGVVPGMELSEALRVNAASSISLETFADAMATVAPSDLGKAKSLGREKQRALLMAPAVGLKQERDTGFGITRDPSKESER